jgi:hypothetical protein
MALADPTVCPDCRAGLAGSRVCPSCRLDLRTPEAGRLWGLLVRTDAALVAARAASTRAASAAATTGTAATAPPVAPPAPMTPAPPTPAPTAPAPAPPDPGAPDDPSSTGPTPPLPLPTPPQRPPRRSVSAGTVLLALGALALLVSGAIFITVYWGPMGILGRALVLLAVTGVAGAVAAVVTRRGLRASAEALWTVFLGLFSLDWFAARDQGLLGLDAVTTRVWVLPWAVLAVVVTVLLIRFGRRRLDDAQELVAVSVLGGLAVVGAAVAAAAVVDVDLGRRTFWAAGTALLVLLAGAAALRRGNARSGSGLALAGAVVAGVVTIVLAVAQVVEEPSARAVVLEGEGGPLALVVGAAALVASWRRVPTWPRTAAAALAVAGATVLVALPAWSAEPRHGGLLVLCGVALVTTWVPGGGPWPRGARGVGTVPTLVVGAAFLPWFGSLLATVAAALETTGGQALDHPLRTFDVPGTDRLWLGAVLGLTLALVAWGAGRWRLLSWWRPHAVAVATTLAVVTGWSLVADTAPPAVVLAASVVAGAGLLWLVAGRTRLGWWSAATVLLAAAPFLALDAPWACVLVWPVAAALLAVLAVRPPASPWPGAVATGLAVAWGGATAAALAAALDASPEVYLVASVAAALVAATATTLTLRDEHRRAGADVAVGALLLAAVATTDARVDPVVAGTTALGVAAVALLLTWAPLGRRVVHPVVVTVAALVVVVTTVGEWPAACVLWPAAAALVCLASRRAVDAVTRVCVTAVGAVLVGAAVEPPARLLELPGGPVGVVTSVVGAALLVLSTRRPRDRPGRTGVEIGAGLVLLGGVVRAAAAADPDVRWSSAALLVAAGSAVLASLLVADRATFRAVSATLALCAVGASTDHWSTAVVAWPVAALVLLGCALRDDGPPWRDLAAGAASAVAVASVVPVVELLDASPRTASLVLLSLAVVAGLAGSVLLDERRGRRGVEASLLLVALTGLLWGALTTSVGWTALLLTVLGAGLVLVSLLAPGRELVRWTAAAPLALAYVLRLLASDVDVVEAYTVPFAVALLLAGGWVLLRREPRRGTLVTLGPGLTLGLLPSLPQALLDPTGPRGLVLGVVSLAVLAVGVRWRWKAPFAAGSLLVALLLVVQLGPVAVALPRWILIAVAGVSMLVVGMTWESRVRDGRAAARWIGAMR